MSAQMGVYGHIATLPHGQMTMMATLNYRRANGFWQKEQRSPMHREESNCPMKLKTRGSTSFDDELPAGHRCCCGASSSCPSCS
ncbi:hypothetical protein ACLKA6_007267 [Drosophila palustris]